MTMSSLADRLAAASRDRATLPTSNDAMATMSKNERRGKEETKAENDYSELKAQVHNTLLQQLGPKLYDAELTQTELEHMVKGALQEAMQAEDILLTTAERTRISQEIADDILGYGPIEPFLRDPDLTEVMVNGPNSIYIERSGRLVKVDGHFTDEAHLRRTIDKIVSRIGRRVDESSPMVDARLPDGSRVNAVIPPLAIDGSLLTIRKFSADPYTSDDLVAFGTYSQRTADFLAQNHIPVILQPTAVTSLGSEDDVPERDYDPYDAVLSQPAILARAGVTIAFATGESATSYELPLRAGLACAYGLSEDAALRALTIDAAKIFGVDDRLGSLSVGKMANVVVMDGDPLEISTHVRGLVINGQSLPLTSHWTDLYEKYRKRVQ